jgi:type 1 glutamine amidotransferase
MKKFWLLIAFLLASLAWSAPDPKLNLLVVSGGHGYDTVQFNLMWKSFPQFNVTFQVLKVGNEIFEDVSAWNYDVLVFYNEQDPGAKFTDKQKANFLALLDKGVGMIVMHHAVASYPFWPEYEKLAGVKYTSKNFYPPGPQISIAKLYITHDLMVLDTADPIMKGITKSFTTRDEGYRNMRFPSDNHLLLRSHSADADTPAAWRRTFHNSRVFTTVLGHGPNRSGDPNIFAEPFFKGMMLRAVLWTAPCGSAIPSEACGVSAVPAMRRNATHGPARESGGPVTWAWPAADGVSRDAAGREAGAKPIPLP